MDQVDGFERANHDFEFGNPAILAPGNHVHAVNGDAVYHGSEFQNGIVAGNDLS